MNIFCLLYKIEAQHFSCVCVVPITIPKPENKPLPFYTLNFWWKTILLLFLNRSNQTDILHRNKTLFLVSWFCLSKMQLKGLSNSESVFGTFVISEYSALEGTHICSLKLSRLVFCCSALPYLTNYVTKCDLKSFPSPTPGVCTGQSIPFNFSDL